MLRLGGAYGSARKQLPHRLLRLFPEILERPQYKAAEELMNSRGITYLVTIRDLVLRNVLERKLERKTPQGRSRMTDPEVLYVRRRPSLPHGPPCSTIGAERLNFRVRNGAGCFPFAMITETLWRCQRLLDNKCRPTVSRELHSGRET